MVFITIYHGKYLGMIELMCKYNCASASASKLCEWVQLRINIFNPLL